MSREAIAASIRCPFEDASGAHPVACVPGQLWTRRCLTDRELEQLGRARLEYLVGGWFPYAPPERLAVAVDFVHWSLALDDMADETPLGQRPQLLNAIFQELLAVLEGRPPAARANRFAIGLNDLLRRLSAFATAPQAHSFCQASSAALGAMLWEAGNRSIDWAPDESAYMMLRPTTGVVPLLLELVCPVNGIELPQHERMLSDVSALTGLAGRAASWMNDLLSLDKERARGDVHNLVIVYERRRGLSAKAATLRALEFLNQELDSFVAYANMLPEVGPHNSELRRYVSCLQSGLGGTLRWLSVSPRYEQDSLSAVDTGS